MAWVLYVVGSTAIILSAVFSGAPAGVVLLTTAICFFMAAMIAEIGSAIRP